LTINNFFSGSEETKRIKEGNRRREWGIDI